MTERLTTVTSTALQLKPIPQYIERGVPLLRRVWDGILADESAWNQGDWIGVNRTLHYWGNPEAFDADLHLAPAVVEYIREHQAPPWNCGTAYCVAGHGALATGAKLPPQVIDDVVKSRWLESAMVIVDGQERGVEEYAQEIFGLTCGQANVLFAGGNSKDLISAYVAALENDPSVDLRDIYVDYIALQVTR